METLAAQVGMTEAEIESAIEHADHEQLADLLYATETALADLEAAEGVFVEEVELPRGVQEMASRHSRNVRKAAKALKRGDISLDEFTGRVQKSVSDNWEKAHRMGRGKKLDAGDEEWLKGAVRAETGYARKFGKDIVDDKVSDKRLDQRSRMYGASVNSSWWNAKVEAQPPGTEIHWKLGCLTNDECMIETERGPVRMRDVKVGDRVLTHRKRWRRVLSKPENRSNAAHRYAVLVCEGGRLLGLTDDHRLFTREGWETAREVALGEGKGLAADVREFENGTFQDRRETWKGLCSHVGWEQVETLPQGKVGVGKGKRATCSGGVSCAPREYGPIGRPVGKFRSHDQGGAQQGASYWCSSWEGKSELERRNAAVALCQMREAVPCIRAQKGATEVLFEEVHDVAQVGKEKRPVLRLLREEIRSDEWKDKACEEERESKSFLLSRLFQEGEGREVGGDPAVWLLWEAFHKMAVFDVEVQVGEVLLLPSVLEPRSRLFDLTVEEDHSFVANGMVVHNSAEHCPDCLILASSSPFSARSLPTVPKAGDTACYSSCKCRLVFKRGRKTPADDQYSERREQTLAQMAGHERPPKGMRAPNPIEQDYIDELRTRMNYHRRKVAMAKTTKTRKRHMAERKRYNRELIDFTEKENIHETPFWSVDDVIDGRHIGIRAEGDVFRNGLDGRTLAMLTEEELSDLLERMGASAGERFSTLDKYGGPEIKSTPPKLEADEDLDELGGGTEYNLVAEGLPATWALLSDVLRAARGKAVEVGPLGDRLLARAHVWVRGKAEDVREVLESVRDVGHEFAAVPVRMRTRRRTVT